MIPDRIQYKRFFQRFFLLGELSELHGKLVDQFPSVILPQ